MPWGGAHWNCKSGSVCLPAGCQERWHHRWLKLCGILMGMIWKIRMAVFPFEKILCKPPPLFTSKMTADVNPCFPLPEPLTSQELPRAHPQTAGVPRSQKPRPLWWRSAGTGHLPLCWIRCFLLCHEGVVSPPARRPRPHRQPSQLLKAAVWAV